MENDFENCSSLWVKYLKLMVTSARFYTFFRGRSLISNIIFNAGTAKSATTNAYFVDIGVPVANL